MHTLILQEYKGMGTKFEKGLERTKREEDKKKKDYRREEEETEKPVTTREPKIQKEKR